MCISEVSICFTFVQKDDTSLPKHAESSRPAMDGAGDQPANKATSSRPVFHRPFLDVEDNSPPEKLFKLGVSEVPNGICAVPLHTGSLQTIMQKTSLRTSHSESVGNIVSCESSKLDERGQTEGDCHEVRDEDGGRDRRLNAALGLISLADVSSDVADDQLISSTETTSGDARLLLSVFLLLPLLILVFVSFAFFQSCLWLYNIPRSER